MIDYYIIHFFKLVEHFLIEGQGWPWPNPTGPGPGPAESGPGPGPAESGPAWPLDSVLSLKHDLGQNYRRCKTNDRSSESVIAYVHVTGQCDNRGLWPPLIELVKRINPLNLMKTASVYSSITCFHISNFLFLLIFWMLDSDVPPDPGATMSSIDFNMAHACLQ